VRNGPRKLTATLINLCLLLPTVAVFIAVIAAPVASAEASCDDPSSDIPAIDTLRNTASRTAGAFGGRAVAKI